MKGIDNEIYLLIIAAEDMGWGEIMSCFKKKKHRTVGRAIKRLVKSNWIEHNRVRGKGKWKRYFVKEENTKQDLTMRVFEIKGKKYKKIMPNPKTTQRNLSSLINKNIRFYKQEFKKLKKEPDFNYYTFHISVISDCLAWITQLTLAINSGMLGDSTKKLEIAKRNKERYEEFLQETLIYNIKIKNEKLGNNIIKAMYNVLVDKERFMEEFLT